MAPDTGDIKGRVKNEAGLKFAAAIELSHQIHGSPELGFEEYKASTWLKRAIEDCGYEVESDASNLPTAFVGRKGDGDLEIGICAEYDALPGVGHACGHNVIAAAAYLAGAALAPVLGDIGVSLRILGTPAEEGGGGKVFMLEGGDFTGLNATMMIHPAPSEQDRMPCVAAKHLEISFTGKEAHAAGYPQLGINALDAMTISQVAIGLARQHIYPYDQVHGIITKGGDAPNVIPARTEGTFIIRSDTLSALSELEPKILRCFHAGEVATGATLEVNAPSPPYSEFITDEDLARIYKIEAIALGREFSDSAAGIRASTDMANISLEVPSIHPLLSIDSWPAVNHQPEFTAAAKSPSADRAVMEGALAMANTIIEVALNPNLRARLRTHSCR